MKKFMKRLIPFLLVLLILASLVWYCFVYDRNFTRDVLLSQARRFSSTGNQKLSSWFYDLAYEHADQSDGVAIELANQFKAEGNYTQAEVTLTNAIADGGAAELYIALCKTYVEQNKLLDAVAMLDSIQDPAIKTQLDQLRPQAPEADTAPGFFSQYITVGLKATTDTIYYTTDGEYPSTDDIPYSEGFTLPAGETVVQAIAVAENGLVSPLSTMVYTIGGVIEEAVFQDEAMEAAVRALLGVDEDYEIFTNELWDITSFTVPEGVSSFADLALLPYLQQLTIEDYTIESLQFLESLTYLQELNLTECRIYPEQIAFIAAIPELNKLSLVDCGLSTIAGLEQAQKLQVLDLSENTLRRLDPLAGLVNLSAINLSQNAVTGLSALSGLTNLEKLDLSYNAVSSLAPLASCAKLAWLDVSHNSLGTLDVLDQLPVLTHFAASHNSLTNVGILGSCAALTELDISNNSVNDISAIGQLGKLELLDFAYNQVENLPSWADGSMLRTIDGSYNKIKSVRTLKNLMELSHVYLDYNEIEDINPLASCYKLVMVNVYGNKVTNVDKLTEQDIIVNYDPT